MKLITAILFLCAFIGSSCPVWAGQAEVRDVALANNCPPKKIEVYKQSLGADGETLYQVQCTLSKTVGTADPGTKPADAILVSCKLNLCEMTRMVTLDKK